MAQDAGLLAERRERGAKLQAHLEACSWRSRVVVAEGGQGLLQVCDGLARREPHEGRVRRAPQMRALSQASARTAWWASASAWAARRSAP